jgi:hypothetical protein
MSFCQYKYILGKPNEGLHTHVFGFAIGDLLMTMILAFIIMEYVKQNITSTISHSLLFGIILLILLLISEYLHHMVCL